jgi:hypothetical protein
VYILGVNSDDGFKMTATDIPPANNGALVVAPASGPVATYHAVDGGGDGSGSFRRIFGPITGKLVYANHPDACSTILNASEVAGNIVLMDRGVCAFSGVKERNAVAAGAIAVIMVNSRNQAAPTGCIRL